MYDLLLISVGRKHYLDDKPSFAIQECPTPGVVRLLLVMVYP